VVEFIEHLEEVSDGPGDPVRSRDKQHLKTAAARIPKEFIEARCPRLDRCTPQRSENPVAGPSSEDVELSLRVLIDRHWMRADIRLQFSFPHLDRGRDIIQEAGLKIELKQIVDVWLCPAKFNDSLQLIELSINRLAGGLEKAWQEAGQYGE
jgi:hypothetical protein